LDKINYTIFHISADRQKKFIGGWNLKLQLCILWDRMIKELIQQRAEDENGVKNKGYGTGRRATENLCTNYGRG
jgi:hypothetical protein